MNDTSGKTCSTLAIAEKRHQRPGGCVGIFFQLFDWNRRLAKKKLFSKKLLPPARAKRASKKFGGDEKLPMAKLLLIADENRGGFPNAKKSNHDTVDSERNHDMRQPGLVARLMGLESMPTVRRDKPKKPSLSDFSPNQEKKYVNDHGSRTSEIFNCDNDDLAVDKGHIKLEARPQKLQKTGLFERRPVTRFGAESLQFKGVLSRSRKNHQKLVSPVKSPRILSGKNAARLMEAATKILEPGLQSTSRAKCALTYAPHLYGPPKDEVMTEGMTVVSLDHSKQSNYYTSATKSLKGQSSCKNCGNLLDVVDFRSSIEQHEPSFVSSTLEFGNSPPQGSGMSKARSPVSSLEQEREVICLKSQDQAVTAATHAKATIRIQTENILDRRPPFQEAQDRQCVPSQRYKSQKDVDVAANAFVKQRTQRQNQVMAMKDRVPPRLKSNSLQSRRCMYASDVANRTKDIAALNRNPNCQSRSRMPSKVPDNSKVNMEGSAYDRQDGSSASIRKRRPLSGSSQFRSTGSVSSTMVKQRNFGSNNGKGVGINAGSTNRNHIKSGCPGKVGVGTTGGKDNDIVSFMFSSPMRHNTGSSSPTGVEKRRGQGEVMGSSISQQKKQTTDTNNGISSSQKPAPSRLDALGVLLEQKLKELTCQDGDEFGTRGTASGRTTASILQELISALTADGPISQECADSSVGFDERNSSYYSSPQSSDHASAHCQAFTTNRKLQAAEVSGIQFGVLHTKDADHPSPGSVLEASFSNDSCFSSSLDDSPGNNLHSESMGCSYDQLQPSGVDADLSDSATSLNMGRAGNQIVTNSMNILSRIFHGIDLEDIGLIGCELNHAREVILNAELLLFGDTALSIVDGLALSDFLKGPLLDKLNSLAHNCWINSNCIPSLKEEKEVFHLRGFLFDCVIECLDLKFGRYCKSGYKTWAKLPLQKSREVLVQEVYEEIRRWSDLAGKIPDEIIELEMSHCLGKWTDFEIEAFETGNEVELDILDTLVDEIVVELAVV
ncbi:PREDICTED: uncharacterized protein LOC104602441 [Nelumbo nucifera]|uniref:Uncharacterized protein LOC104602441 n=1 Tax=Nelumbo nucifera TaxID=4432 RepID=A0A1U8AC54_NELNU|nr:PREDICTED: uncharacterized protein LOC104602441 [Nelumbo nucifera]